MFNAYVVLELLNIIFQCDDDDDDDVWFNFLSNLLLKLNNFLNFIFQHEKSLFEETQLSTSYSNVFKVKLGEFSHKPSMNFLIFDGSLKKLSKLNYPQSQFLLLFLSSA